jgi:hypothetical protein
MGTKITRLAVYHSNRFRSIDNVFPSVVAEAYDGDIAKAAEDTLAQVFDRVRDWEIKVGREPQNWRVAATESAVLEAGYEGGPLDLLRLFWAKASEKERTVFLEEINASGQR